MKVSVMAARKWSQQGGSTKRLASYRHDSITDLSWSLIHFTWNKVYRLLIINHISHVL